jgi:hypothetical protein
MAQGVVEPFNVVGEAAVLAQDWICNPVLKVFILLMAIQNVTERVTNPFRLGEVVGEAVALAQDWVFNPVLKVFILLMAIQNVTERVTNPFRLECFEKAQVTGVQDQRKILIS